MAFNCEQFDKFSELTYQYVLFYFYEDSSMEMLDKRNGKVHLKRTPVSFSRSEFFLGATLNILGKTTKIIGYADEVTYQLCEDQNERTTIIVSDAGVAKLGKVVSVITEELGISIVNMQMAYVKQEMVEKYMLPDVLKGTSVIVLQCVSSKAMEKGVAVMQRCAGVIAASDHTEAKMWGDLCLDAAKKPLAVFGQGNSTVVIVKPHVIVDRVVGNVIQLLCDADLEITAASQFTISTSEMNTFMQPYRGVLPDIEGTVNGMVGTVWAIQFMSPRGLNVIEQVRGICGPYDPQIARHLYPKTIRARFGKSPTLNCVHCCDLPEDGPVYADFCYKRSG